ncbi:hypothetical protein OE749_12570 [Aestuariibacter sp. AA17]|uniref:Uncharacterized protein n=1 Tax=Fluctibacter corallii TaxID=2984329 RepID=A0ABT3AAB1_9ALTE|nr:hypothetical protein [Aestuariibacter sp. AA17]MCV2885530.1 hypothetical protein [Aestuariibacter sp. AA17]
MNRSTKGFGLAGVLLTVIFLVVAAVMSSPASALTSQGKQVTVTQSP